MRLFLFAKKSENALEKKKIDVDIKAVRTPIFIVVLRILAVFVAFCDFLQKYEKCTVDNICIKL